MARKKSKANYFTSETEDYIKRYNRSEDNEYRNQIFTDHIYLPFYKLVENIIHTFKFYYTDVEQIEDLKHEVVTVLLEEKIMKFDPDNGAKAYSYFGTIVKRWLINYNNKNYKKLLQTESTPDSFALNVPSYMVIGEHKTDYDGAISLGTYIDMWVAKSYVNLDETFYKDSERKIADAILTIFKKRSDLEIFKKKALYIYIREMTDCETPQLTRVIATLKKDFYEGYLELYERGLLVPNLNIE